MQFLNKLFGTTRQGALSFLLPIALMLLVMATMTSCGKDEWVKETEEIEDEEGEEVAGANSKGGSDPDEGESEDSGAEKLFWQQVLENLRIPPK